MIIEVYRGAGDRPGKPVIELTLSDAALQQRGRAEMDANAHQLNAVEMAIVPRPGLRLGQLVTATDPASAAGLIGKVVGIQIVVRRDVIDQSINLEVPA